MAIKHLVTMLPEDERAVHVQTLAEFMATATEAQMYLLEDTLVAAGITIISGRPKIGRKSLLMYVAMLALASGKRIGPFVPCNPDGEAVIIFEQENTRAGNAKQWRWLARGLGFKEDLSDVPKLYFYYKYPKLVLEDDAKTQEMLRLVRTVNAKQVVFDSLRRCSRGNENDSEASNKVSQNLGLFQLAGCGVTFLHHVTKTSRGKDGKIIQKDIDEDLRGSGDWAGMYDQHWGIRETDVGDLSLQIRDKNDGDKFYSVEWFFDKRKEATTLRVMSAFDEVRLAEASAELLEILAFGTPITLKRAQEALELPVEAVEVVVTRLQAANRLTRDAGDALVAV